MAQTVTVSSRGHLSTRRIAKSPDDVINVKVDFGLFFDTDTAATLTISADSGLTVDSSSVATNIVDVVLSGGDDGYTYDLDVTLAGTTETKKVTLQVAVADYDREQFNDYWYRGLC